MLKIPSQQYAGIVEWLRSITPTDGNEHRQFTRIPVEAPVRLGILNGDRVDRCIIALSRDISANGVGLCESIKFAPKQPFLISLPSGKQQILLLCQAMFCRTLADGLYNVGARFESVADAAQAEEFRAVIAAEKVAA